MKNKKRWSQVMYMSYVLDYKEALLGGKTILLIFIVVIMFKTKQRMQIIFYTSYFSTRRPVLHPDNRCWRQIYPWVCWVVNRSDCWGSSNRCSVRSDPSHGEWACSLVPNLWLCQWPLVSKGKECYVRLSSTAGWACMIYYLRVSFVFVVCNKIDDQVIARCPQTLCVVVLPFTVLL